MNKKLSGFISTGIENVERSLKQEKIKSLYTIKYLIQIFPFPLIILKHKNDRYLLHCD